MGIHEDTAASLRQLQEHVARGAVELDPSQVSYWTSLAAAFTGQCRYGEAAGAYRQAVARNPSDPALWQALATSEHDAGNLDLAQVAFEQSLALAPEGTAAVGLAYLVSQRGDHERALRLVTDFLSRMSHVPIAWVVLAHVYLQTGAHTQAEQAAREALKLSPKQFQARIQLTEALAKQWRITEAESEARALVADEPDLADGWKHLGLLLGLRARHEDSLDALRRALALRPDPVTHSKLLCGMQYVEGIDAKTLAGAHEEWAIAYEKPRTPVIQPAMTWRRQRKLRLGFVSTDFCQHPIGFLALPLLEHLDKSACSVVCYADGARNDEYTARFRAVADKWQPTYGTADQFLEERIGEDQIDVLFDLMGHFGNRLTVFARRLAPVQVTWLGYVGTTGLSSMDYLLADQAHVRPGEEEHYTERVLRLPNAYACYAAPRDAPGVAALPAVRKGYFTFGCFNNPAKFTHGILDAWTTILTRVPRSRLLVKYCSAMDLRAWLLSQFERRGVTAERIDVAGNSSQLETMAAYNTIDLALDTQPYSGGLTTCESLWMGVPVITFPGRTFAGRHAASYLANAGYAEFIAADIAAYVELAVSWANRPRELAAVSTSMREQVRASAVCDAPRFADDFLRVIREVCEARFG